MLIAPELSVFVDELIARAPRHRGGGALVERTLDVLQRTRGLPPSSPELQALTEDRVDRYVLMHSPFAAASARAVTESLARINKDLSGRVVPRNSVTGMSVVRLSPLEAAVIKERFGALLVERDPVYRLAASAPKTVPLPTGGDGRLITVRVLLRGQGVPGARVTFIPTSRGPSDYRGFTREGGMLKLLIDTAHTRFSEIVVDPPHSAWSRIWRDARLEEPMDLHLEPLDVHHDDWGAREVGGGQPGGGRRVRVGVIDTGVAPHPRLRSHLGTGACLVSQLPGDSWNTDPLGHGTHCAGIIAAVAPEVEIVSLRVIGKSQEAFATDIADAVREGVRLGCDLLNISLAGAEESTYLRSCLDAANDAGVLSVAAAGNSGGAVAYPACVRRVIGVTALGRTDVYPGSSIHARVETEVQKSGHFFAAFSNRGPEVAFVAPGVAILSTFSPDVFAVKDGTSMAAPHVTGVLAVALGRMLSRASSSPERSLSRALALVDRVLSACRDVGMSRDQQGAGMPCVDRLTDG